MSTMARPDDMELMCWYDGELSGDAASVIEAQLADDPAARAGVATMAALGAALRDLDEQLAEGAPDLTGEIMARIAADDARSSQPALRVVRPAAREPRRWVAAAAAVLAAAAAAVLVVRMNDGADPVDETQSMAPPHKAEVSAVTVASVDPAPATESSESQPAVYIESIEFGANGGSIFVVSGGGEDTPVVWLSEEQGEPL